MRKSKIETIYHSLFECEYFKGLRKKVKETIARLGNDQMVLCWDYVINMKGFSIKPEYEVTSVYKDVIWRTITKARWESETFLKQKIHGTFDQEINLYFTFICY